MAVRRMQFQNLPEKLLGIVKKIEPLFGRKALQKKIYLAQALGLKLGYNYKWYLYGPYSSELTDEIDFYFGLDLMTTDNYKISVNAEDLPELDANESRLIDKLNSLTHNMRPNDLELMASIHFLVHKATFGTDKARVFKAIDLEKPQRFDLTKKEEMWKKLQSAGLI